MMTAEKDKIVLMDRERIKRSLKRIAYQIAEKSKEERICIVGLNERGYAVAGELYQILEGAVENDLILENLYIDSTAEGLAKIQEQVSDGGTMLLLVDDVMFSGKTMFKAMKLLNEIDENTVYTVVLIDRGHRTLPVHSSFVGMEIPTKAKEHVEMTLRDGKADQIFLYKK